MALHTVTGYSYSWYFDRKDGRVTVRYTDPQTGFLTSETIDFKDINEMSLVVDMLRNEEPVKFDPVDRYLRVPSEPVGENEP